MKQRLRVVGLCLVVVFALSAVVMAGSAQAGQMGSCEKATKVLKKYTGEYTDKLCTTKATVAEITAGSSNRYQWTPSPPFPFVSQTGVVRIRGSAGEIICEHGKDYGSFLAGGRLSRDRWEFTGCELKAFELICTTRGQPAGTLISNPLNNFFVHIGSGGFLVGMGFTPAGVSPDPVFGVGPWLMSFECGGIPMAIQGSVGGGIPPQYVGARLRAGKLGKEKKGELVGGKPTFTDVFSAEAGEQELTLTLVNPLNENKVESGAAILEGINEVMISPLPKGLEILDR